ncbi:MAG: sulfite exporter TauE/SafE family protein [Planctomyces sp.]|nr:sulfite exporter TauE/SafE family protein [Planctomyces sp.]
MTGGELGLIAMSGLLGSAHCIGMCGGFAAILALVPGGRRRVLARQLVYSAGRIFTYATFGLCAGTVGMRLSGQPVSGAVSFAATFSILCGAFLVLQGLSALGLRFPFPGSGSSVAGGCLSGQLLRTFLQSPGRLHTFLAGVMTGFLPCGLVYAFVALAASRAHPFEGLLVMAAFGAGTVPLMAATGLGASWASRAVRQRMLQAAACCVIATGLLTIARGAGFLRPQSESAAPDCPFCMPRDAGQPSATEPR